LGDLIKTVKDSAHATELVESHVGRAVDLLENVSFNGDGIFSDVSMRYADLIAAHTPIQSAIAILRRTTWPTRDDYDAQHAAQV
jgi:hypothetical protein